MTTGLSGWSIERHNSSFLIPDTFTDIIPLDADEGVGSLVSTSQVTDAKTTQTGTGSNSTSSR
jgi:hypothetical protein